MRNEHLQNNLQKSAHTVDLFKQYKKHLGSFRYKILKEGQILVVPQRVNELLALGRFSLLKPIVPLYKLSRKIKLDWLFKSLLLPHDYKAQIRDLNIVT